MQMSGGKSIPGSGYSKSKGPEVGTRLMCSREIQRPMRLEKSEEGGQVAGHLVRLLWTLVKISDFILNMRRSPRCDLIYIKKNLRESLL